MREDTKEHLNELAKYLSFTIKYNNTENNRAIHDSFSKFAWDECDGSYLQAIKRLLENYSMDYKYESLFLQIEELKTKIIELENQPAEKKKEVKFFGERE